MHQRLLPLARVLAPVFPLEDPKPVLLIFLPLACVFVACLPYLYAETILDPIDILSEVLCAVEFSLVAPPMLDSVHPVAAEYSAVRLPENAVTAALVASPPSLVNVFIRIEKLAFLARLVEAPLALVDSPVRPGHCPCAMSHASNPLPLVHCSGTFVHIFWPRLNLDILHFPLLPQSFSVLRSREVQLLCGVLLLPHALDQVQEPLALHVSLDFGLDHPY